MPHECLDDLRANRLVTEQARQCPLHRLSLQPTQYLRETREAIASHAMHGIEDSLGAPGGDATAHETGDVLTSAVPMLVAFVEARERIGDHVCRCVGCVQQLQQWRDDIFVTVLTEHVDHRSAQQVVRKQRHEPRCDGGIPNRAKRLQRRKARGRSRHPRRS